MIGSTLSLPVIDINAFVNNPTSEEAITECKKLADACIKYSAFAVKDDRVTEEQNAAFLNMLEDYFGQTDELKMLDTRPELHFQVGATPANTELPRCGRDDRCLEMISKMDEHNKPLDFNGPDPKWRFFWRMGSPPKITKFAQLNAEPVSPAAFPQWSNKMNFWGGKMLDAVSIVTMMLAVGLDLEVDTFTSRAMNGPHLLAPTGSDLSKYGKVGTVLAGFHYDLNFFTIHGKSRFPGLNIWTRDGDKLLAKIPDGCLLVQAGKQLEYLTGGKILAGYHEVCVVDQTLVALERQKEKQRPLWRISSTLFYHLASDGKLEPLPEFKTEESIQQYPAMLVGEQVQQELGVLELASK